MHRNARETAGQHQGATVRAAIIGVFEMKRIAIIGAILAIAGLGAGPSLAQGGPRVACATDLAKFCPNAAQGPDRHQCMMSHRDQLSDGCKTAIAAAMARRQAVQSGAPHT
jgi:hypothetical protein